MDLYYLLYQSQALVPFETPELSMLLEMSRANNQECGITGLLLYTPDGRFLQVLEGTKIAVRYLYYNHIAVDPRHYGCRVLAEGMCLHRSFADWRMGFRVANAHDLRKLLALVPPDSSALLVPRPHTGPEMLALLLDFVAGQEVAPRLEHPW